MPFARMAGSAAVMPASWRTATCMGLVGPSRAKRLLYTSDHIGADEALSSGLVDEVVEPEELLGHGKAMAHRIASHPAHSVRLMKRVLDEISLGDFETALAKETEALVATYAYSDIEDAARAFTDRRRQDAKE